MPARAKSYVFYIGDWAILTGPTFVESPFYREIKDTDIHFYGQRLVDALEPKADVTAMSAWKLYHLEPGGFEKILRRSSAIIVSDVEAHCFSLYPAFFDRAKRQRYVQTFPDRLVNLRKWVKAGGGLVMLGGWLSFSGANERGGWRRSPIAEVLPVECLLGDDLVDSSAGFTADVVLPDHALAKGLPWRSFPPIFGYNQLVPKDGAEVVVRVKETGHPLVVVGKYGKGRIAIYASDPAPHWGINFELWSGYDKFWQQMLRWVGR